MSFEAPYDAAGKAVTASVLILFVTIAIVVHSLLGTGLFALLLVASYAWSPSGYSIVDGAVVVRRLAGNARISLDGLRDIRLATADDFRGCVRVFGSGGLFGHFGIFRTAALGKTRWYVTDRRRTVVLVAESGTTLFSPENAAGFIAAVRSEKPGAILASDGIPVSGPPIFEPVAPNSGMWILGLVLLPVLALVGADLMYAPGPPSYTLTSQSLTIRDKFYPVTVNASSVDVENVRIVDVDRDPDWQPVKRTNGFGNAHYHSGRFRVSNGETVRMYRADGKRLVLLPPKDGGMPVLLETREPEKLVDQLRNEWAHSTGLVSVPIPSIATSTTSPAFI